MLDFWVRVLLWLPPLTGYRNRGFLLRVREKPHHPPRHSARAALWALGWWFLQVDICRFGEVLHMTAHFPLLFFPPFVLLLTEWARTRSSLHGQNSLAGHELHEGKALPPSGAQHLGQRLVLGGPRVTVWWSHFHI